MQTWNPLPQWEAGTNSSSQPTTTYWGSAIFALPAAVGLGGHRGSFFQEILTMHIITEAEEKRYAELQSMALDFARRGETDSLQKMVVAGLPVNLSDAKGNSLLMLACYHGNADTARMLLDYGADVDRRNDRKQTPLGGVAFKGYAEIVALLLDYGANIHADNGAGMTPLMFAAMFGRTEVVELLKSRGASLQQRTRWGLSAKFLVRVSEFFKRLVPRRATAVQA